MRKTLAGLFIVMLSMMAQAGPETITYQGSVLDSLGKPIPDDTYRMQFKLYDAAVAGTNQWTETQNVEVIRGLFSTALGRTTPLHPVFMGHPDLWLEVTVDVDRSGTFEPGEVYSPRQNLAGTPWACPRVEPNEESPNLIGGMPNNRANAGVAGATIGGGGAYIDSGTGISIHPNRVTDNYGTVGGGEGNRAGDNSVPVDNAEYATVGGGRDNVASAAYATVGGGESHEATGDYSTVAGGRRNKAPGERATVGGGTSNRAGGQDATVAGGNGNYSSGTISAVCGGAVNYARGGGAAIGGGGGNSADGNYSTIPGGEENEAAGDYSFAAGRLAHARHLGSFVLTDARNEEFASVRDNQLRCRFDGGATFQVNDGYWFRVWHDTSPNPARIVQASNGAHLTAGGAWVNGSDRNSKENFEPVSGEEVLEKLADVPIQQWNYRAEDPSVRHMGPTAQDLHAAFGLGGDDKSIATIDADGISLAAIQGLHQLFREREESTKEQSERLAEQRAQIEALTARCERQAREMDALKDRLAALEAGVLGEPRM